jgi:hypothetical protein
MNFQGIVTYTSVYNREVPNDTFSLLRKYPTDLLIHFLSQINLVLFQEEDSRSQSKKIFYNVFINIKGIPQNYEEYINSIMPRNGFVIFKVQSISYLIKECLSNYKDINEVNEDINDYNIETSIFNRHLYDTILIYNGIVFHNNYKLESRRGLLEIGMRDQNYIRDFLALFQTAPIKFLLIQRYFLSIPSEKKILESFVQRLGLTNFWNFAQPFIKLMSKVMINRESGEFFILDGKGVPPQVLALFIFDKTSDKDIKSIHMDIIPKPFYKLGENSFTVLDLSYFRYIIDQGIFRSIFENSYLNDGNDRKKNFNIFQTRIGKDYFERFLVGNLLKIIFDKRHHLIAKTPPIEDFWVKPNQKDLIIVEVKMPSLHAETSESFNVDGFIEFVINNFAKPKDSKGGAKGAYQLISQLRLLENAAPETMAKLKLERLKKLNVYPIIIYSDQILDTAGVSDLVQSIFQDQLKREAPFTFNVKDITMIGINTLLEQFSYFKDKPDNLLNSIRSYHLYIRGKQKDYNTRGGPSLYYDQNISFAEYIRKKYKHSIHDGSIDMGILIKLINKGHFGTIDSAMM